LSRSPLVRFPTLQASSILLDANAYSLRPLSDEQADVFLAARGISDESALVRLKRFASGSRALLEGFSDIEQDRGSGNQKREKGRSFERAIALASFEEIGPPLCASLEQWAFEYELASIPVSEVRDVTLQALRQAGLLRPSEAEAETLRILPMENRLLWLDALGDALESVTAAPREWRRLVEELFRFERDLRRLIRQELCQRYGEAWAEAVLPDLKEKIVSLARRDTSPSAVTLARIRAPLDWLSLNELLDLAAKEASTEAGRLLGHSSHDWREVAQFVVPVRNRVAHMRMAQEGDWEAVQRIRRQVSARVSLSK
jgi:hypothetical protein